MQTYGTYDKAFYGQTLQYVRFILKICFGETRAPKLDMFASFVVFIPRDIRTIEKNFSKKTA